LRGKAAFAVLALTLIALAGPGHRLGSKRRCCTRKAATSSSRSTFPSTWAPGTQCPHVWSGRKQR